MQTLVVANPKGGSGKTTLATNAAGWLAGRKQRVVLADFDPLRAATEWLARRPPLFPAIGGWSPSSTKKELKGEPPHWLVIDTPADPLASTYSGCWTVALDLLKGSLLGMIHDSKRVKLAAGRLKDFFVAIEGNLAI